jgi:hypothetical protein
MGIRNELFVRGSEQGLASDMRGLFQLVNIHGEHTMLN